MTCKEFRSSCGIATRAHIPTASNPLTEHISTCADCRQFFEMQQEANSQLRLVRDSVPQVSAALDDRVLAGYRDFVAGRMTRSGLGSLHERIAPLGFSWRGAVVACVLTAAILSLTFGGDLNKVPPPRATEAATVPQSPNLGITTAAVSENTHPRVQPARAYSRPRVRSAVSVAAAGGSLPAGFRSLMYCDQLSCAEAMEIIRVQLPTSIAGLTPGSTATGDAVFADVLVGPDGIARGIRIVE